MVAESLFLWIHADEIQVSFSYNSVQGNPAYPTQCGYSWSYSNHQKVMKQVTMYKIPHTHVTTEAMTTTHLATGVSNALCALYMSLIFWTVDQ